VKKKLLFFIVFFLALNLNAAVKYNPFLDKQIKLTYELDDNNLTQEDIHTLIQKQESLYENQLYVIMANKQQYIDNDFNKRNIDTKIFSLKKIIAINKRAGNSYAVLRDEVHLKSYLLVSYQYDLLKNVLMALDLPSLEKFENRLTVYITEDQKEVSELGKTDYNQYLRLEGSSSVIKALKQNIRDFQALQEIHNDMISYLYKFENKMYRLNKYYKFHVINLVIYLGSFGAVQKIDVVLGIYGLSLMKLIIMLFLTLLIYAFRKIVYVSIQRALSKVDFLEKYSETILSKLKTTIETLVIIININIVLYVYNDFSGIDILSRVFNIIYGVYFTLVVYILINTIASIKLSSFSTASTPIKSELINVGIKIINFVIIIIGILIALYFAGIDLTAVLSGLGIGGFAVAFAAKDTISNFFGTLSILFSDVFSQGDWIEVDGKEGVVVEIGLRVTTLRTFDNALIAIPNGTFASKDVKNWNKRKLGRRIKMKLGVKYNSKKEDINNAILEMREMLQHHPDIATQNTKYEHRNSAYGYSVKLVSKDDLEGVKKTLLVFLDEFDSSSINILIYCFSKTVDWEEWLTTKQDVMEKIMDIMEKNSLEFAFPSLSIYNETQQNGLD
jgi:MscS family membrane protein